MFQEDIFEESPHWVAALTASMASAFAKASWHSQMDVDSTTLTVNSGRIYFEQLHLHPVRIGLTFTQEWLDYHGGSDTVMVFQFIRGMVRFPVCYMIRIRQIPTKTFYHSSVTGFDCKGSASVYFLCCWTRF
jgi:hypothetical protein